MANKLSKLTPKATVDVPTAPSPYKPSKSEEQERRRYRAEDAMRTLTRAREIEKDRSLMRDVKQVAMQQMKELQCVVKGKPSGR